MIAPAPSLPSLALVVALLPWGGSGVVPASPVASGGAPHAGAPGVSMALCAPDPEPPEYYAFPLVTTRNIPGTGQTDGEARVTFPPSPFGVALRPDGSYRLDVHIELDDLPEPPRGTYVAWATTTQVDQVKRLGALEVGETERVSGFSGEVGWNKFLVVITLEPEDDPEATTWSGPIVLRGMSRSGAMHTMAGHGPFQEENCAAYGYE